MTLWIRWLWEWRGQEKPELAVFFIIMNLVLYLSPVCLALKDQACMKWKPDRQRNSLGHTQWSVHEASEIRQGHWLCFYYFLNLLGPNKNKFFQRGLKLLGLLSWYFHYYRYFIYIFIYFIYIFIYLYR